MQTLIQSRHVAPTVNAVQQKTPMANSKLREVPVWASNSGLMLQRASRPQFDPRFEQVFNIDDEGVELPQEFWALFSGYTADTVKFGRLPEDDRDSEWGHYDVGTNEIVLNYDMYFVTTSDGKAKFIGDPAELFETLLHEGVHARAANYGIEGGANAADNYKPTNTEFNQMGQHEYMAQRGDDAGAIDLLYQGLKNFDNMYGLAHSDEWYIATIFKGSLNKTMTYQMFSEEFKAKIDKILDNEEVYRKIEKSKVLLEDARTNGDHATAAQHEAALESLRRELDQDLFTETRTASSAAEHKAVFRELPTKAEQLKSMR